MTKTVPPARVRDINVIIVGTANFAIRGGLGVGIMSVIGRREQERRYLVARENELCFANRHLSNERDGPYTFCWR